MLYMLIHKFTLQGFIIWTLFVNFSLFIARFNTRVSYAVTITKEQGWSVACPLRTSISQYQWRYAGRNQRTTDCTLSNARFFLILLSISNILSSRLTSRALNFVFFHSIIIFIFKIFRFLLSTNFFLKKFSDAIF